MLIAPDTLDRLKARTEIDDKTGCWNWVGSYTKKGYGKMSLGNWPHKTHRISYIIHKGPIPHGLVVMHSCDNRKCWNPAHLSVGTQRDNVHDMIKKGRRNTARGRRNASSKLIEEDVPVVLYLIKRGCSQRLIGELFGVAHVQIGRIARGEGWSHVSGQLN